MKLTIRYMDPTLEKFYKVCKRLIFSAKHFVTPKDRLESAISAIQSELRQQLDLLNSKVSCDITSWAATNTIWKCLVRLVTAMESKTMLDTLLVVLRARQNVDWLCPWRLAVDCWWVMSLVRNYKRCTTVTRHARKFWLSMGFDCLVLLTIEFQGLWVLEKAKQTVFVSATPGNWELEVSPARLLNRWFVRRSTGSCCWGTAHNWSGRWFVGEIRVRASRHQRVLVTTLTKRMAEDLTDYLAENEVRYVICILRFIRLNELRSLIYVWVNTMCWWVLILTWRSRFAKFRWSPFLMRTGRICVQSVRRFRPLVVLLGIRRCRLALRRQHDGFHGEGHWGDGTATHDSAGIQRQAWRCANSAGKASNSILSFLELSRKLKQDGQDEAVSGGWTSSEGHWERSWCRFGARPLPELIDQLEAKMKESAKKLDFEEAANLRDRVNSYAKKCWARPNPAQQFWFCLILAVLQSL